MANKTKKIKNIGICRYDSESESEFKDWATDAPGEYEVRVFDEWKKGIKSKERLEEMDRLLKKHVPGWEGE